MKIGALFSIVFLGLTQTTISSTPKETSLASAGIMNHLQINAGELTFKSIHGLIPSYLSEFLRRYISSRPNLRSGDVNITLLVIPRTEKHYGDIGLSLRHPAFGTLCRSISANPHLSLLSKKSLKRTFFLDNFHSTSWMLSTFIACFLLVFCLHFFILCGANCFLLTCVAYDCSSACIFIILLASF